MPAWGSGEISKSSRPLLSSNINYMYSIEKIGIPTAFMAPAGLLAAAEDIIEDVLKIRYVRGSFWARKKTGRKYVERSRCV